MIDEITARKKLKQSYEYEVSFKGLSSSENVWVPRDELIKRGFEKVTTTPSRRWRPVASCSWCSRNPPSYRTTSATLPAPLFCASPMVMKSRRTTTPLLTLQTRQSTSFPSLRPLVLSWLTLYQLVGHRSRITKLSVLFPSYSGSCSRLVPWCGLQGQGKGMARDPRGDGSQTIPIRQGSDGGQAANVML